MDKNNKKVNNAENTKGIESPAFDEITDGFYDLSTIYKSTPKANKPHSREDELKQKDKQRRETEMQAFMEDVERRYSMQVETASSTSPDEIKDRPIHNSKLIPEDDGQELVKDELERIDEIINDENIVEGFKKDNNSENEEEKKSKFLFFKRRKIRKPQNDETIDTDEFSSVYGLFYSFGNAICNVLSVIFNVVFGFVKRPFVYLFKALSRATESTKRKSLKTVKSTLKETVNFRNEIKRAVKTIRRALRKPKSLPAVIVHYFKQAISRHKGLLKTAVNTLLPLGALAVFLITYNYWTSVTFALEVIYNDQSIGYISNESIYIEAKDMVKDRLSSSAYSSDSINIEQTVAAASASNLNAKYNLSLVSIDELNDAQALSDKMIENSVDNLTHACGIYIDGEFICAVKNEADAKTVFYDILAPYEADAELKGYAVGFAETIDYVQGLYRDDESVMWDASGLSAVLTGGETPVKTYVASEYETIENIIDNTGASEEKLKNLNPEIDFDNLREGDIVVIEGGEKLVSIRKIVTTTSIRDIEYEVVKKRDATKYSGYRQVLQKGVDGSERVTKTQIYIDGELYDTEYSYETIVEPVDEIVTVGTKTSYGGVYVGEASDMGFLWPAPSCHSVSSPYGWRSSGWHNGIDLVKSGGGALGTPVIASRSGRVEVVQRSSSGYGNMVLINHGDGYKTRYAHMVKGSITVSVGDYVDAGQTIGKVGSTGNSTGPHLHFEVIRNGETQNPKNFIY